MGFCLFKEAGTDDFYFTANVAHIEDVVPQDIANHGYPVCLLKFGFSTGNFVPLAAGTPEDIRKLLTQASKIGLGKVEAQILAGRQTIKPMPLLLNQPDRVALLREMRPEEFSQADAGSMTASQVFFSDGSVRLIAGRPGAFAFRVNADGRVPGAV